MSEDDAKQELEGMFVTVPASSNYALVLRAADKVFEASSGKIIPRSFLLTRSSYLRGMTPLEIMGEIEGPQLIWQLACTLS